MSSSNPSNPSNSQDAEAGNPRTTIQLRVRYVECDPMNVAHHSSYIAWLEMARTELLRELGIAYKDCEAAGVFFVVARLSLSYKKPAHYDDVLEVYCEATRTVGIKIEHRYEVRRASADQASKTDKTKGKASELLATAESTLACVDRDGKVRPLPEDFMARR